MQKYGVDNDQKQRRRTKALAGEYRITRQRPEPVKADKAISHSKKEIKKNSLSIYPRYPASPSKIWRFKKGGCPLSGSWYKRA
jgi:hypothetical protein